MSWSIRRLIRLGLIALANAAVLLALFAVVEWGLRRLGIPYATTWTPTETAIARFDPELGWSYRPNLDVVQVYGENVRLVVTDEWGVRVPRPGWRCREGAPSVLLVGGSVAFGHGLAYGESVAGRLADRLRLQVVDLGVQAYGTDQSWLALQRHLPRFSDVRAVVYVLINEHIERNGVADRRLLIPFARFVGTKPQFGLDADGRPVLIRRPCRYEDYANSWLVDLIRIRVGGALGLFPPHPTALTEALVEGMAETCREAGTSLLVVHWRRSGEAPLPGLAGRGLTVLDLGLDPPPGWDDMTIPGDGHPDATAHDAAAARIAAALTGRPSGAGAAPQEEPR